MDLDKVPNELLYQIALYLSPQQLINFYLVNSRFLWICQDETFWLNKVKLDYQYTYKPTDLTWQQFYVLLARQQIKGASLIYKERLLGIIWLKEDQQINQILSEILQIHQQPLLLINFNTIAHFVIKNGDISSIKEDSSLDYFIRKYTSLIEIIDDPSTIQSIIRKPNLVCLKCYSSNLYKQVMSVRAADEPPILFTSCLNCGASWKC